MKLKYQKVLKKAMEQQQSSFPTNLFGINCILGDLGSGKTLLATLIGFYLYRKKNYNVYANYELNFSSYPIESDNDLINAHNGIVILDEIYTIMDSREWQKAKNKVSTEILRKSRKKHIKVVVTAQFIELIDLRLRKLINRYIYPEIQEVDFYGKKEIAYPSKISFDIYQKDVMGVIGWEDNLIISIKPEVLSLYNTEGDVYDFDILE